MDGNNSKWNEIIRDLLKRKARKLMCKLIIPTIILLLFFGGALAGTGIISAYSFAEILGNFFSFFEVQSDGDNLHLEQWIENATADELVALMDQGYSLSKSDELLIKINQKTFRYLLQKCSDYENMGKRTRTITVQGYRQYLEEVVITEMAADGSVSSSTSFEPAEEFVEKEITVSNEATEGMLTLDWRLLYMYSMIHSLDRKADAESDMETAEELMEMDEWFITKKDVEAAYNAVAMKYIYDYDIMADAATYYDFNTCLSLPHETEIYGNEDTASGKYTWNYPQSLMSSAVSGYSSLTYLLYNGKIAGIREIYSNDRFQNIGESLCPLYTYNFFEEIFSYIPGGKRILSRFNLWGQQAAAGNAVIYNGYFAVDTGNYPLPEGVVVNGSSGDVNFSQGNYGTIGEAAVALARSRLNWKYSQGKRMSEGCWDCSSMICRVYNELGLDITASGTTVTLRSLAIKHNQKIAPEDLRPGDAIWYQRRSKSDGSIGNHVMLYSGNGNVIHAKGVKYGTVEEPLVNTGYKGSAGSTIVEMFYFRPYTNLGNSYIPRSGSGKGLIASELYEKSKMELVEIILNLAVEDAKRSNILPSITAAQFILESAWGKSGLAQKSNNCFGMKTELSGNTWSGSTWDTISYVEMPSNEEELGIAVSRISKFRAYQSINDSFSDHSAYLYGAKKGSMLRYAGIANAKNYSGTLDILVAGGYATDSSYKSKLTEIIQKYDLNRYDSSYANQDHNKIVDNSNEWQNGQRIAFREFADQEYANFSKINTGSATYYRGTGTSNGKVVCVNAGHGTSGGESQQTQSHPDGTGKYTGGTNAAGAVMSTAISSGTTHVNGTSEAAINLKVAKKMKGILLQRGYDVVMIRETGDVQLDNIARTVIANNTSDCHIAVHFDATTTDKGCFYMSVVNNASYRAMEPVKSMWPEHELLGAALVDGMVAQGMKRFGSGKLDSDLTQTSYSTIPSVDIEYGDRSSNYSDANIRKIATGICDGIDAYFGY